MTGRLTTVKPMLLVDGDLLADIALLAKPDKTLRLIMKDGTIYKRGACVRR